jgi:hypothetical protein
MKINLRTAKMVLITGILLFSLFTVVMPAISTAGPIKNWLKDNAYVCYVKGTIDYDKNAAQDPILPLTMIKTIPLTVNTTISGYFSQDILPYYETSKTRLFADIYVVKAPEWCTASVVPSKFTIPISLNNIAPANFTLNIGIKENAPAIFDGMVTVKSTIRGIGAIKTGIFYQNITFTPGYLPFLKIDVSKDTFELIGPGDTANFDIEIENLGNAKTNVTCNVLDVPEGWTAYIEPTTLIGSRTSDDNPKKTLQLVVKPPYGFGYHDEREVIRISITPSYFDNESLKGEEYFLSFIVQSRGFSTPGFESVLVIFAFIGMTFIVKKQRRKKTFNVLNGEDDT